MTLGNYFRNQTEENYVIVTAKIKGVDAIGKNSQDWLLFSYEYRNKIHTGRVYISDDSSSVYKSKIGEKINLKIHKNNFVNKIFLTYKKL